MVRTIVLSYLLISFLIIIGCKSKSNTPSPSESSSGYLTISGVTENLTVTYNNSQPYQITGAASTGIYASLAASFQNGQPATGFTVTFPSSNPNLLIYNNTNGAQYNATSGSAIIQVSSSFTTTITFMNVTFTSSQNSNQTIVATGQLINVN
jgi:hypothetical protein